MAKTTIVMSCEYGLKKIAFSDKDRAAIGADGYLDLLRADHMEGRMATNCVNCGAPFERHSKTCGYCESHRQVKT